MSTIQEQMLMYHTIESILKEAAQAQQPVTLRDVWEKPEIRQLFKKEHQVRDKIGVLVSHKLVTKVTVAQSQSGDRRHKVAYMWADLDRTADAELNYRQAASGASSRVTAPAGRAIEARKPVPAPTPSLDVEVEVNGLTVFAGRNVELFVDNVKCVVDKNPETGRVRIAIT
jgi:hypothetical protein